MSVKTYTKGKKYKLSANFVSTEFDCHGSGCCKQTKIDTALVTRLQQIRNHFGKPITLNSAYRCATHNKRVGGATGSRHTKGQAADIVVKDVSPAAVAKYAEHLGIKGIGLYDNFVHIDTRTAKSFWYSHNEYYRSTFGGTNPYIEPVLNKSKGNAKPDNGVRWIQWELNFCGYNCGDIDGYAGSKFDRAVRKFQKDMGLAVDGIVGKDTRKALKTW